MNITFGHVPKLFGPFHIGCIIVIILVVLLAYRHIVSRSEDTLLKYLHRSGAVMLIAEVFKQLFCYIHVFDRQINCWFFPWQLCSMAMYLSFLCIYLDRKKQDAVLVFLSTFSLLAAAVALAIPEDMLRKQVLLTLHGFAYHGLMIVQSLIALTILKKRKGFSFGPALVMFLAMAFVAQIINVICHQLLHDIHLEPNMFYITPYYPSTQPVFNTIALRYGITAEIIIYLGSIILVSYLIYLLEGLRRS